MNALYFLSEKVRKFVEGCKVCSVRAYTNVIG